MPGDHTLTAVVHDNCAAATAFGSAAGAILRHRPGAGEHIVEALSADPDFAAAHALWGLMQITLARCETMEVAVTANGRAQAALAKRKPNRSERAMCAALDSACCGRWRDAADILEYALDPASPDVLLVKLAHSLRFMAGDAAGMLALTQRYAGSRSAGYPGFGFVAGCHAFALEETGAFEAAELAAQCALFHEPEDVWAMHALAHVYEMNNRTGEGVLWVESGRQLWSRCNNFAKHLAWHLALFHADRGACDKALAIYDRDVRIDRSEDFRDVANAVSLLERLQQTGVDIGDRFDELHELAGRRRCDATYVFASLHHLVSLLAKKDFAAAEECAGAIEQAAENGACDQALAARNAGAPLARAMLACAMDRPEPAFSQCLAEIASAMPVMGGSFAQRDVFLRKLLLFADAVRDYAAFSELNKLRRSMRREDSFDRMLTARRIPSIAELGQLHVA
ncbi:MAG: tetratricopeptide repeat protein [Beijerinckiaceae bacterium]